MNASVKVHAVILVKEKQIQLLHLAFREELLRLWPGTINAIECVLQHHVR